MQSNLLTKSSNAVTVPEKQPGVEELGLLVTDLRKSFQAPDDSRIEVLRGLSLTVAPAESVAIMGASGSGKSTLLHLLGGLDEPNHGSIMLKQVDVTGLSRQASSGFRQTQIGFVFQFHYLLGDLTAAENVALPLLIQRQRPRDAFMRANMRLAEFGLEQRARHPVVQLSGGEQQRVALARALVTEPTLILADEPTGNLDTSISEEIAKTLTNYVKKHSRMAVIATHNPGLARMCDRVLTLEEGRLHSKSTSVL